MSWLILLFAGLFEIVWAIGFRLVDGFGRPWLYLPITVSIVLSMGLLAWSIKEIPLGTAYAVWTGIGVIGTFIAGIVFFSEPVTVLRIVGVVLVLTGLTMLKITAH